MSSREWTPARVRCTRERVTGRSLVQSSFQMRKIASTRILDEKVNGTLTKKWKNRKKMSVKQ